MALVYAVVGTVTSALGSQMGALWAKGWVVYLIAIFFIAMALFLMDVFTFPTPRFLMNIQAKASKPREGYLGAFMVGAVSGLVVGPCTGPIIGTVLAVVATSLEKAEGIEFVIQSLSGGLKLFVFGFGQGTLIILCGIFAGFLSKLPKSGAWMVTFKKVFASIIILGATLLLVYAGQETDFPRLTNLLAQAESSSGVEDGSSGEVDNKNNINTETGNNSLAGENSKGDNGDSESKYGGDEFLE
jgi:thiol:disulfide interchange protein DsbD